MDKRHQDRQYINNLSGILRKTKDRLFLFCLCAVCLLCLFVLFFVVFFVFFCVVVCLCCLFVLFVWLLLLFFFVVLFCLFCLFVLFVCLVDHDATRNVLTRTGLGEEGIEGIVATPNCLVTGHLSIWLNAVLEAEQFPAGIADLDAALAHVKAKNLTHDCKEKEGGSGKCLGCKV